MTAQIVILLPVVKKHDKDTARCCTSFPVVNTCLLGKSYCPPASHPRSYNCNRVDSAYFNRCIPPDILKAFPAEQLADTRYIFDARVCVVVLRGPFYIRGTSYPQFWNFRKFPGQEFKIFFVKRYISIEIPNDVVTKIMNSF